jgi:SAM-dependent methyltransferase
MTQEASKAIVRRGFDRRFATRWFVGQGIDIGAGDDPLSNAIEFFPLISAVRAWDVEDGDAMLLEGVEDGAFDFVHSSHCLEHLRSPQAALLNWLRVCKPSGHLIITVPDEDLYEQGVFPSTFNHDHKWTFTIGKKVSWSPLSISILDLLMVLADRMEVLKLELLDHGYRFGQPRWDQTLGGLAESAIEFVARKR